MNASNLLDQALGQLEGESADLALTDPAIAGRLDRLERALGLLLADDDAAHEPPAGLADRTVAFVERRVAAPEILEFIPSARRGFRFEDLAVAATIFLASALALAPAIVRGRERWGRAACQNNLQKVGLKLNQYAAINQAYPFVSADSEVPNAGAIVCHLNESGTPIDPNDLRCPCSGSDSGVNGRLPKLDEVARTLKRSPGQASRVFNQDFAFHIGNYPSHDSDKNPQGEPGPLPVGTSFAIPVVADRPDFDPSGAILDGNSPNHGGQGQNVLYADGHAAWHSSRWIGPADRDLYLNNENRPAYGIGLKDAVLMPTCLRIMAR